MAIAPPPPRDCWAVSVWRWEEEEEGKPPPIVGDDEEGEWE
jgi:hypothetical protein